MKTDSLTQFVHLRQQLLAEKNQLQARLQAIQAALGANDHEQSIAPAPTKRRGGRQHRGKGAMSLREAMLQVTAQHPMTRNEIVAAVQDLGYVFGGKNPLAHVNNVLYRKNSGFQKKAGKFSPIQAVESSQARPKRTMSAEARKRISVAQKKRWAARKSANAKK